MINLFGNIFKLLAKVLVLLCLSVNIVVAQDKIVTQDLVGKNSADKQNTDDFNNFNNLKQISSDYQKQVASLSFAWNTPANLAAFERGGKFWLIFDSLQKVDVEKLKVIAGDLAENIMQFPHPMATLVRITPAKDVKFSVRKEGLLWVADLYRGDIPDHKFKNITIFTQYDSLKQPYLFIPNEYAGNVISIIDPDIGDIISTAPSSQPHQGVASSYHYPEFDILQTIQGLAFVVNAPDILLTRGNSGLILRAQGRGLNITSDLDALKRRQQKLSSEDTSYHFNLQIPQKLQEMKYVDAVEAQKKEIISVNPLQKNKLRLELARYYIHHGLGTNALYILNQMKNAKLDEAKTDDFYALSGVANFLARRYKEAVDDFSQGNLPDYNEGIFWRTLAQSAYEFNEINNAIIFAHISLIKDYPQEIKDQIALVAAENAIKTGDDLSAQNFIDVLRSVQNRMRNLTPHINYLSAKKLEVQGYPRNAVKEYRNIIHSSSAKYSAFARYDNTILSQKINIMSIKDAIVELERLRFAWGEHNFKYQVLNQLASLYLKDFDYYNALRTLNEAGVFVKDDAIKQKIANRMINVFEDIFLSNQADAKLSPIKALALYQDFSWLANLSTKKNAITQRLADRLVAVDLLPRAKDLLLYLLSEKNISIDDKARIGARIAVINLFEKQPYQALEILRKTDADNLLPETTGPRRVIQARAYTQLEQTDKALEILKDDYGKTALLHKFEIYWAAAQWDKAADTMRNLIEEPEKGKPLSEEQINFVLDWATTLKQSGKETVLVRVRNKFMPYFANTEYHSIFNILTKQLEKDKVDIGEIGTIVNDVQAFTNYAKIYGENLTSNSLE